MNSFDRALAAYRVARDAREPAAMRRETKRAERAFARADAADAARARNEARRQFR